MPKNLGSTQCVTTALLFPVTVLQQHLEEGRGARRGLAERRAAVLPALTATASLKKSLCHLISLQFKSQEGLVMEKHARCF